MIFFSGIFFLNCYYFCELHLFLSIQVFSPKYNRSDELIRRSTQLKDTMREASVQVVVDSWYQILVSTLNPYFVNSVVGTAINELYFSSH